MISYVTLSFNPSIFNDFIKCTDKIIGERSIQWGIWNQWCTLTRYHHLMLNRTSLLPLRWIYKEGNIRSSTFWSYLNVHNSFGHWILIDCLPHRKENPLKHFSFVWNKIRLPPIFFFSWHFNNSNWTKEAARVSWIEVAGIVFIDILEKWWDVINSIIRSKS